MLKQHPTIVKQAIAFADTALVSLSFLVGYILVSGKVSTEPIQFYWVMYAGFLLFYLYFAWTNGLFSVLEYRWVEGLLRRLLVIVGSASVLGASLLYLMPDTYHGRRLYLAYTGLSLLLLTGEKLLLRLLFLWLRRHNHNTTSVLMFGRGRLLSQVAKEFQANPQWGFRIKGRLDIETPAEEFERVLTKSPIEEVVFCVPPGVAKQYAIDPYLRVCEQMGRSARVFLTLRESASARWQYQPYLDFRTMVSHTMELDPDQLLLKRAMDILGGCIGVAMLAASYPLFALAIKLSSPGPVFFRQERVGRNNRRFSIYKYRSMVVDAEQLKKRLEKHNELEGAVFKMKDDPRVTRVGRFLRRFSLDEWPQFLNVLYGEMSLVGTRPPTPDEVEKYENWHHRRISTKPGLTGLWQVSGRNRITNFDEIVRLDLKYIDSWSIWLDIRIIMKTITAVFKRGEAY